MSSRDGVRRSRSPEPRLEHRQSPQLLRTQSQNKRLLPWGLNTEQGVWKFAGRTRWCSWTAEALKELELG